jgi:hypothetical protein
MSRELSLAAILGAHRPTEVDMALAGVICYFLKRPLMRTLWRIVAAVLVLGLGASLLAAQRARFGRERFDDEVDIVQSREKTEYAFARLRYDGYRGPGACFGYSKWATDYPKGDRQFMQGVQRLTRLHNRAIEQVVDPESDEVFDWPWLFATEPGSWTFPDEQADRMREYFLKGGFLMVDDFHGSCEWRVFMLAINKLFPGRAVEDLTDEDEIYHVLYDIEERFQISQIGVWRSGRRYEKDGVEAKWRAVRDDKGRIMIAIGHNMDLADAWEWADNPTYAERYSSLAYRVGINYIMYAMTH